MPEDHLFATPDYRVDQRGKLIDGTVEGLSNWGRWGELDERGAANYITPEVLARAGALIRQGRAFSLALPIDESSPTTRPPPQRFLRMSTADNVLAPNPNPHLQVNDDLLVMGTQASTQWDGLGHVAHRDAMYNGFWAGNASARTGMKRLGIHHLRESLVGRGVLLDIARYKGVEHLEPSQPITGEDLEGCARSQGVEVRAGDMLLVRTGHIGQWPGLPPERRMTFIRREPGMGLSTVPWLHQRQVASVSIDTMGAEVTPHEDGTERLFPWHVQAIVRLGLLVGELWSLDRVAEDCARDGVHEFFLAAQPLYIPSGVGSPVNPIALK